MRTEGKTVTLLVLAAAISRVVPTQIPLAARPVPQHHADEHLVRLQWTGTPAPDVLDSLSAQYDVWRTSPGQMDLRLPAHDRDRLDSVLGGAATVSTLDDDVGRLISRSTVTDGDGDMHATYHTLDAVDSLLRLFAADHPSYATLVDVGRSAENRTILGLRVGRPLPSRATKKGKKRRKSKKSGLLVVGGQHAREWISTAATLYAAHDILIQADRAPKRLRRLLDTFDFTFVPVVNPDGYEYSWKVDRLWRKTRQAVGSDGLCHGIDLNRNWGHHWLKDTYDNPCADSYPGDAAFEAVEARALRDFIAASETKMISVLDLHSFGQMLMYPYAYTCSKAPRHAEDLIEAAYGGVRAAESAGGLAWEVGAVCEVSYTTSGEFIDWAYGKGGIKWAFSVNLRDVGVYGFLLPPSQIRSAGEETLGMLLSIADFVRVKERL